MRKLDPELIKAMDAAVKGDADFELAVKNKIWRPAMTRAAAPWEGVKEYTNKNDGPFVDLIGLTVDQRHKGEAYCMAWTQTILAYVEYKLSMPSILKATEGCLDLWNSTPAHLKTTSYPLPGYIAVWQHGSSPAGHTGIVFKVHDVYFKCLEANSIGPDGVTHGIFMHDRLFNDGGKMVLLGFICPY